VYDIILGSDVFYSGEDFEPVLELVAAVIATNPQCIFITAYQERSSARSLAPYLERFGLSAEAMNLQDFMHPCHLQSSDELIANSSHMNANNASSSDSEVVGKVPLFPRTQVRLVTDDIKRVDDHAAQVEEDINLPIFRDFHVIRISAAV